MPKQETQAAAEAGPLQGLRVLDLTEHMAGPFCTMILADMGAEVIKLERPGRGDSSRAMGDGTERNPYFRYINRNKLGITLDYKRPEGRKLFLALVETVDVLVENYRPTVMPRAGLGWETLRPLNPRLIYAQLSGLGYDGPLAGRGGFDLIAQGMGGIMHVTGEPDGPPTSVGLPICDLGTGMWGAQGILAALYERQRTGTGNLVECSLLETAVGFSSWTSAGWLVDKKEPTRQGSRHRQNVPYQRLTTQDGYLILGAGGNISQGAIDFLRQTPFSAAFTYIPRFWERGADRFVVGRDGLSINDPVWVWRPWLGGAYDNLYAFKAIFLNRFKLIPF